MDGFDNAFDAPATTTEVDPAAQFLAQEQEDLGGLGEDLGFTAPPVQDVNAAVMNGGQNLDFLADHEPVIEVKVDEDEIQSTPPMGMLAPAVDDLGGDMGNLKVKEEPEFIKKWKSEQVEKLRAKDEAEEKSKDELKAQARKELEDWYKHYNEQLEKTKETNRNNQETLVSEVNDIQPGTEWERVAKQCDFNSKNTRNNKDVSRMRGILLQLKQNPPTRD